MAKISDLRMPERHGEAFNPDWLPGHWGAFVRDVASMFQVDVSTAAISFIAACDAATCGVFDVVRADGNHRETGVLWVVLVAGPSEYKTPVLNFFFDHLRELAAELEKRCDEIHAQEAHALFPFEAEIKSAKEAVSSGEIGEGEFDAQIADIQRRKIEKAAKIQRKGRLLFEDTTPEKLGAELSEGSGHAVFIDDEGTILDIIRGSYSKGEVRDALLKKAYTGARNVHVDRKSGGSYTIREARVSVALCTQPVKLTLLAANEILAGDGFLARCLFCLPEMMAGKRKPAAPSVSAGAKYTFNMLIDALFEHVRRHIIRSCPEYGRTYELTLTDEAEREYQAFAVEVEALIAKGGALENIGWLGKLRGQALRLAKVVRLLRDSTLGDLKISAEDMRAGVNIARWAISHACAALDDSPVGKTDEQRVLEAALAELKKPISRRFKPARTPFAVKPSEVARRIKDAARPFEGAKFVCELFHSLEDAGFGICAEEITRNGRKSEVFVPALEILAEGGVIAAAESYAPVRPVRFKCNVDSVGYTSKPGDVMAQIKPRLGARERITETTIIDLRAAIESGFSFMPSAATGARGVDWVSQQLICADIDNGGAQQLTPEMALKALEQYHIKPALVYNTFSSSAERAKFRAVILLDAPLTDSGLASNLTKRLAAALNAVAPGCADTSVSDNARVFFGSRPGSVFYAEGYATPLPVLMQLPDVVEPVPERQRRAPVRQDGGELKAARDNFDLVGYILRNYGGEVRATNKETFVNPCPICGHYDCFNVSKSEAVWHCFSAGHGEITGGSIIDFIMAKEHVSRAEACARLTEGVDGV